MTSHENWKGNLQVNLLGLGPSSHEKRIYQAAVSQRLRNDGLKNKATNGLWGSLWAIVSDSATTHLVRPVTRNTAHIQQ